MFFKLEFQLANWKSTVASFLTLVIMTTGYFMLVPSETLVTLKITPHILAWLTVISALAKLYVGLITKDAK